MCSYEIQIYKGFILRVPPLKKKKKTFRQLEPNVVRKLRLNED